jgi:hypothetical protein
MAARLSLALIDVPASWLIDLPERYRKRSITSTTMGEARSLTQPTFVKPADGRKGFESKVYGPDVPLPDKDLVPDTTEVLVAEPVTWEIEFRCFVLDRRVTTLSSYLREDELTLTKEEIWAASQEEREQAEAYITALLADQELAIPPAVVIDIGIIRGRGWAVVEANSCWAAGIYGCDPTLVLPVLARACIKRDQLTPDEARWVNPAVELDENE